MSSDYFVRRHRRQNDSVTSAQKVQELERRVARAVKHGLVYKVVGGWNVPRLKLELAKRGYIEVIDNIFKNMYTKLPDEHLLEKAEKCNEYEQALLSKLMGVRKPKFVWTEQPHFYEPYAFATLMNKIKVVDMNFWLKDGLLMAIRKINGRVKKATDRINFPRSYDLGYLAELRRFKTDFKLTLATGIIRYLNTRDDILAHFTTKPSEGVYILDDCFDLILDHIQRNTESESRHVINPPVIAPATKGVKRKLSKAEVKALQEFECERKRIEEMEEEELRKFQRAFQTIVREGGKVCLPTDGRFNATDYVEHIVTYDELVTYHWPWRCLDTARNVWLVKPTASGEGQGIKLFTEIEDILDYTDSKLDYFVVQKYIEYPLLIYNTKFDLRQYFLVTIDEDYFRVWCHPVCSVKLASEEFNLDNFSESIHLTNASIQQKYFYKCSNPNLPNHHMWNLGTFILYLENEMEGQGHMWEDYIYPEIKRSLRKLANSICFHTEMKPGRFELFGCDWIIDKYFKPYLLEINRPPCLGIYSPVSTTVCGAICEDIVKVAVDFAKDPEASTGGFEVIYVHKYTRQQKK